MARAETGGVRSGRPPRARSAARPARRRRGATTHPSTASRSAGFSPLFRGTAAAADTGHECGAAPLPWRRRGVDSSGVDGRVGGRCARRRGRTGPSNSSSRTLWTGPLSRSRPGAARTREGLGEAGGGTAARGPGQTERGRASGLRHRRGRIELGPVEGGRGRPRVATAARHEGGATREDRTAATAIREG